MVYIWIILLVCVLFVLGLLLFLFFSFLDLGMLYSDLLGVGTIITFELFLIVVIFVVFFCFWFTIMVALSTYLFVVDI